MNTITKSFRAVVFTFALACGGSLQAEVDYLKNIKPLLRERCYSCHGAIKQEGGLRLDTAARGHQLILRLHDTYPGRPSGVPAWIKASPGYRDLSEKSEGQPTGFLDWTNAEWQRFVLEFVSEFARKYDTDPRLAFLEVGFGLWAEYHVYDPGEKVGVNFPDKAFQAEFLRHMTKEFQVTRWLISKDAHVAERTPFKAMPDLLALPFGLFDDTFHRAWKPGDNRTGGDFFGLDRWQRAPAGGEQLIGSADFARMIGNIGVAPIYYDAYPAVNEVRAAESLAGLLPGERRDFTIASGGTVPALTIESDRLIPGQRIEFESKLNP